MRRSHLLLASALLLSAPGAGSSQAPAAAETGATVRQEIVVTNQNLAVVVETRRAELPSGEVSLAWAGVASSARTETWSLTNALEAGVRWRGLLGPLAAGNALADLVGRRVRIERPGGGSADAEVVSVSGGTSDQVLFREGNDLVYGEPGARLVLPGAAGTAARAGSVILTLSSQRAGARDLTSRYLVSDIDWEANYALVLERDERSARLEGWFTLDNRSGADFAPARLRLLAGTLRVAPSAPAPKAMRAVAESVAVYGGVVASEAASESRMYEVPSPARLAEGRTTFPLAENAEVPIEKRYVARTSYWVGENVESQTVPVSVVYSVGAKKLEAALPAGVVRVYTDGGTVFGGEDRIGHTPERTDFELEVSEAFDLRAKSRQTAFTQTGPRESEAAWEVVLTSRKKETATVLVQETFPGDWTVLESSVPAARKSARLAEFAVAVPAGGEAKLTYRVRVKMGR
jgi:hypothetical protein